MDLAEAKRRVCEEVERRAGLLLDISHRIHARPELLFEEHFAAHTLASALGAATGVYGVETAFEARTGSGGPTVAVLCEYDALPGIGHGCGHNVIAAAGLGAGLAASAIAEEAGGTLVVLGTPAEEGGGGKILMAERGAFDGVDAAMMVHPAAADVMEATVVAICSWHVEYFGRGAHAAAFPERGRNALDAAVLGYNAVAALRQHLRPGERVHGVFLKAGDKPNIVPDHTVAEWYVRSATLESLQPLKERVRACLAAGAAAAGCEMTIDPIGPEYADLRTNQPLAELFSANSAALGRDMAATGEQARIVISTDMGNVSHLVASVHPMIDVAPDGVSLHTAEFASWAVSEAADRAVLDGARAMAMTAADLWLDPGALERVRAVFGAEP